MSFSLQYAQADLSASVLDAWYFRPPGAFAPISSTCRGANVFQSASVNVFGGLQGSATEATDEVLRK